MLDGRVLVTGAGGLIGRHVVNALLDKGLGVHATGRLDAQMPAGGKVNWHKADLLDQRARGVLLDTVRPETIIHCAWVTEHNAYWTSPENLDWVAATVSLAREAQARGTRRFVGVGTCAEYQWGPQEPLNETNSLLVPATLYGVAKDATRRTLETFAASTEMSFAWARVFMLYGAGEHPDRLVASLARSLARGEPAKMSSGNAIRDLMDARDVGAAIAALALAKVEGPVNIASGSPVTLRHVGETLARLAGTPERLRLGAYPDRPQEPLAIKADVTRLTREVGFRPRIELERGLQDALLAWTPGS